MTSVIEPEHGATFEYVSDDEFEKVWNPPPGLWGRLQAVQNQNIGFRFIATSFFFFTLAGIAALLMRLQLAVPENTFLSPNRYNELFTMHGSTMMFLFLVPLIEGMATLILPQMFGSRELPFPRLTSFAYWTFLAGGLLFWSSFFFQAVPDEGWFAYVPLSGPDYSPGRGMDFWLLGLNVAEVGAIAGAFEIILAFFKMRSPGMSLNRIPIFAWAMLVTAFMMVFAFTPLIVGSLLLEFDRKFGTQFYDPDAGGSPLLWQHIFWIFGHPDVYIQFLPTVGMVSTIIPVFARQRIVGYTAIVVAMVATGFLSFGLWVHHMFATGLPELTLSFFSGVSTLIAIPTAVQVFAWTATIWKGRPVFKTPFLFALGFFAIFVLGGITGIMVGSVPTDLQLHDSYFVVAHFHYVLFGGAVFPAFAGFYFWMPKFLNRMFSESLGKLHFWLLFIGFNVTFFPMHISGLLGMPRRVYTYLPELGWEPFNLISTFGAFVIALSIFVFFVNVFISLKRGPRPGANPWNADTLEWAPERTPARQYGFRMLPIVQSRHPLWDQENLYEGTEDEEQFIKMFALWPNNFRAQLVTTALDARPQEVIRISGPSIWPVVSSIAIMFVSFFLIYDLTWLSAVSLIVGVFAIIMWHRPEKYPPVITEEKVRAFEALTGVPMHGARSRAIPRWTMVLTLLAAGVALLTLIFVYLYLRLQAPTWPPPGFEVPDATYPLIATGALLAGAGLMFVASRGQSEGRSAGLFIGLAVSSVLGLVYPVLMILHLVDLPFRWDAHAYASSYYALLIFVLIMGIVAVLTNAVTLYWVVRSGMDPDEHSYVPQIAWYWYGTAAYTLIVLFLLFVLPYAY